ncbi:hypothetical protein BDN72DRAFT_842071 [Pluteus cervinus]|uniref:Uncharacterized protein n=1 Tax=Pluteus cervinus TaxID=181527 RepID=A0ACD3AQN6_9AGAR|nr:hypothetical protein BDN72DRAFT_842071 [Pluteus cervinus]
MKLTSSSSILLASLALSTVAAPTDTNGGLSTSDDLNTRDLLEPILDTVGTIVNPLLDTVEKLLGGPAAAGGKHKRQTEPNQNAPTPLHGTPLPPANLGDGQALIGVPVQIPTGINLQVLDLVGSGVVGARNPPNHHRRGALVEGPADSGGGNGGPLPGGDSPNSNAGSEIDSEEQDTPTDSEN